VSVTGQLVGYRERYALLLTGAWVGGELLCFALNEARSRSFHVQAAGPRQHRHERLLILPDVGFVRFAEIEHVHRRARLEIGIQGEFDTARASLVLRLARECAFEQLNLNRIYGSVRTTCPPTLQTLSEAGFRREATLPAALRVDGELRARELWGALGLEEP
jgi:hypothetical protein